ncbi:MAG: Asp-tRNA(Asn)/Glu-tRNA(Gln) amidotransferase subunit GatC [Desulfovibrio sp.]|nr:Asp-tRNA(Asn)/Glu-tRNA(Gln) amidotransferase subunit GatC [Desulfovibrio sp.]
MSKHTPIGLDEVKHMATLSRLSVSEEEQKIFASQFADILAYMDVLTQLDVKDVEPLFSPVAHSCLPREDKAANLRTREEILKNAPEADGDYFIVPRIV